MPYIPNSREDQKKMLDALGVSRIEDLFTPIPDNLRLKKPLPLPEPLAEAELVRHLEALASKNRPGCVSFAGGGLYNHFIPAAVWNLAERPEFSTAYTPYQAEVAQGTLQAIYEYQTHVCRLTGMDVANASMYDGATATAEAAMLAVAHTGRHRIVVSETVNPMYREVLATMAAARNAEIVVLPSNEGVTSADAMKRAINDQAACLILAQPNFFGMLEDLEAGEKAIHAAGGLFIMVFDPISLGILKTPAEYNADIAVGEGQSLGIPRSFGGPLLGIFACRQEFIRKLPGRLVGRTVDADGKTGFVLTLQTREQHIRREKATSNICSNEALCATAATIYMSLMGKQGLPRVARLATERAHYLADKIAALNKYAVRTNRPFFKEFVVDTPLLAKDIIATLGRSGIVAGIDLGRWYPAMDRCLLVAVTEMVSVADCDAYAGLLAQAAG
ncbi:MAG: aminomethyl-transferring glycine dehydrogenase subunit GcvPA [candidate division Zixibacteria bacterium]|nr:aminomethyl-transferring glycine dehydrogenase subunit GcvPA [candidate division Zixibacteria bacterium]